jgi:drug/metabolite transporter (DMT)-like permease
MKPIWYFVGLILMSMGAVVLLSGLYRLFISAGGHATVLQELRPDIWWGAIMILAGGIFFFLNRKPVSE